MSTSQTGKAAHDAVVNAAEAVRQTAVVPGASQATVNAAEIAFYRTCLASAKANGVGTECFTTALKSLGVQS